MHKWCNVAAIGLEPIGINTVVVQIHLCAPLKEKMMNFYFVISEEMATSQAPYFKSHETTIILEKFEWKLNTNTYMFYIIQDTIGKALDSFLNSNSKYQSNAKKIAICRSQLSEENALNCLRCALVGDSLNITIPVDQITWFNLNEQGQLQ